MTLPTSHARQLLRVLPVLVVAGPVFGQAADTSEWNCELCPFSDGYAGTVTAGATTASDDSAWLGDATGYDESGVYGNLDSTGTWTGDEYFMRWSASDLLLDSRSATLTGGQPGRWNYDLSYRAIPRREYFTTETVFERAGNDRLDLPADWVRAPQTSGFTALSGSLTGVDIGGDRSDLRVGGRYRLAGGFSATAHYRRHAADGTRILGGSSYTTASLLPAPYDTTTDEVDLGIEYLADNAVLSIGWFLSDFGSADAGLTWTSPFTTLPGAETSQLAQPPDSRYQQVSVRGGYNWATWATSISASASIGEVTQDTPFLAYTTNATLVTDPLPAPDLDGSVDVTHYAVSVSARPLPGARLRLGWRDDERDNNTDRSAWNRVIVDSFASGAGELNTPYSFRRRLLTAEASYDLLRSLRLSGGYERRDTDRDYQEVARQTEDTGWLGLRWRYRDWLSVEGRGGSAKRDIDRYDETLAVAAGQNPLLRKYNLAYRYREFADVRVTINPTGWPLSLSFDGMYADDSYTKSLLGMQSAEEVQLAADLTWTFSETASWYVDVGLDSIESVQNGSESFGSPDWTANYDDAFVSLGTGLRLRQIADRMDLTVDLRNSDSVSELHLDSLATGADRFPDFETRYNALRVRLDYRWSERLLLELGLTWQSFESDDWMRQGVDPATIPAVLTLGAEPWDDSQVLLGLGFRYDLAAPEAAAE